MPLQGSGAISLSQIQTEFGGANPISMSEYYRNGAYTTSNNTGVPTSGAISVSQFYSTSAADYVPAAIAWADFSSTTDDLSGGNSVSSSTQTLTGINQTITLNLYTTNWSCTQSGGGGGSADSTISIYVNGSFSTSLTIYHNSSGASNGTASANVNFTAANNATIYFEVSTNVGHIDSYTTGSGSATWGVKNVSSSNTVLDTFVATCGASTAGGA